MGRTPTGNPHGRPQGLKGEKLKILKDMEGAYEKIPSDIAKLAARKIVELWGTSTALCAVPEEGIYTPDEPLEKWPEGLERDNAT
ncbi:hypothetical protein E1B28_006809 [Marasmius oreades]|uniref:DUF5681 domain-containing protein n=1 Tax=Marasmius oreades TaxID=181124 RepID=A0A9P8ABI4_9AGAR|nr:uncharacterized protein E1B28_006809 [Marasmius oreades]KAG7096135.1 hypothetical protein E1B28_006809 [Marasmius oreades]